MKTPWDSFEKNYVAVETVDEHTGRVRMRYEYYGPWLVCRNPAALKQIKVTLVAASAVIVAAMLWCGLSASALNRIGYTCVPYGLALAAMIFVLVGVGTFLVSGEKNTRPDHERTDKLLRAASPVLAVLMMVAFLAAVLLLLTGGIDWQDVVPAAGYLLTAFGAGTIYLQYRRLRYGEEKNTEFEWADNDPLVSNESEE